MRQEPTMKIEIIIASSRCLIRANVHIFHENRGFKTEPSLIIVCSENQS